MSELPSEFVLGRLAHLFRFFFGWLIAIQSLPGCDGPFINLGWLWCFGLCGCILDDSSSILPRLTFVEVKRRRTKKHIKTKQVSLRVRWNCWNCHIVLPCTRVGRSRHSVRINHSRFRFRIKPLFTFGLPKRMNSKARLRKDLECPPHGSIRVHGLVNMCRSLLIFTMSSRSNHQLHRLRQLGHFDLSGGMGAGAAASKRKPNQPNSSLASALEFFLESWTTKQNSPTQPQEMAVGTEKANEREKIKTRGPFQKELCRPNLALPPRRMATLLVALFRPWSS